MATRHTIEVFSAGCLACDEGIKVVREVAGKEHEIKIHDMRSDKTAQDRARQLGIRRVPAVVVDGELARCCDSRPVDPGVIRALITGDA